MKKHQDMPVLARDFLSSDDERCIAALMKMHCIFGHVQKMLSCTKIQRYEFEFNVGHGRVDLALFHSDGGVSLVEIKGGHHARTVVGGIGQLFLYEAMYASFKPQAKPPRYLNKYLVAPIGGYAAEIVGSACAKAGIVFISYAPFSLIRAQRSEFKEKWGSHGKKIGAIA